MRAADFPPAPPELAERLRHRPECDNPDVRAYLGHQGDVMVRCATCAYYVVVRDVSPDSLRVSLPEEPAPTNALPRMSCVRCATSFAVRPGRATVPLCPRCRQSAEAERAARARGSRGGDIRQRRAAQR
jgi:hypothetical protein